MERSHTSSEEIHQEKLAEYHLRIKEVSDIITTGTVYDSIDCGQAQLQQKLMRVTEQLESGENPTLTNVQYLQQLKDDMSSCSKKQDKVRRQLHMYVHMYVYVHSYVATYIRTYITAIYCMENFMWNLISQLDFHTNCQIHVSIFTSWILQAFVQNCTLLLEYLGQLRPVLLNKDLYMIGQYATVLSSHLLL